MTQKDEPQLQLPEDVLVEILARIPIKLVVNFKTVSKKWCRLISSNYFVVRQHKIAQVQNPNTSLLVLHTPSFRDCNSVTPVSVGATVPRVNTRQSDIDFAYMGLDFNVQLLIPVGFGILFTIDYKRGTALLWNPTTREFKELPPSPDYSHSQLLTYHFGTMDYNDGNFSCKVGRVTTKSSSYVNGSTKFRQLIFSLQLYSSETNSWKVIPAFCASEQYVKYWDWTSHCPNLNGRVHWVICFDNKDISITSFDYKTEVFGRIMAPLSPEVGHYDTWCYKFTLFDDKFLCLILFWSKFNRSYLDIWVMREYGVEDSWTKEFTVGPIPGDMKVLEFSSKAKALFLQNMRGSHNFLFICDCKSSKIERFCQIDPVLNQFFEILEHTGSLFSLSKW